MDRYAKHILTKQDIKNGYIAYTYKAGAFPIDTWRPVHYARRISEFTSIISQDPFDVYTVRLEEYQKVGDHIIYVDDYISIIDPKTAKEYGQLHPLHQTMNVRIQQEEHGVVDTAMYEDDEKNRIKTFLIRGIGGPEYMLEKEEKEVENIVPDYYASHSIMPSDFIEDWDLNFNRGSAVKYVARAGDKIEPGLTHEQMLVKDLTKARTLIDREIKRIKRLADSSK